MAARQLAGPTPADCTCLPCPPLQDLSQLSSMTGAALHMMGRAIFLPALRAYPPSLVAATLLYCARQNAGTPPLWPTSLIELTGESVASSSFPPTPPRTFGCVVHVSPTSRTILASAFWRCCAPLQAMLVRGRLWQKP